MSADTRLLRIIPVLFLLALASGCGLNLEPRYAEYSRDLGPADMGPALSVTAEVAKGQSLLEILQRYTFPAWLPKAPVTLPEAGGEFLGPVPMGRAWVQYWTLDGDAVLSAPADYAPGLGLVVDDQGNVTGSKPLIDLRQGVRPAQEAWGGRMRGLFTPTEPHLVDLFQFDLVYGGLDGASALLLKRDFKHGGPGAAQWTEVRLEPGRSRQFQGVVVQIIEAGPESLTCRLQVPAERQ